jgi:hypothetical protein
MSGHLRICFAWNTECETRTSDLALFCVSFVVLVEVSNWVTSTKKNRPLKETFFFAQGPGRERK